MRHERQSWKQGNPEPCSSKQNHFSVEPEENDAHQCKYKYAKTFKISEHARLQMLPLAPPPARNIKGPRQRQIGVLEKSVVENQNVITRVLASATCQTACLQTPPEHADSRSRRPDTRAQSEC